MKNPWINYKFTETAIHQLDIEEVESFNDKADEKYKFSPELWPEPYIGNLKAKIVLLALNPGLSEDDYKTYADTNFKELHRRNIDQVEEEYPFYYLNPQLKSPGSKWWHMKLKLLIQQFGVNKVANSVYCLQYMPYHSVQFKKHKRVFPTQKFTGEVLKNHIDKNLPIVIMRSKKHWIELVPELEDYTNTFILRNPRNPTFSPRNMEEGNFEKLIRLID